MTNFEGTYPTKAIGPGATEPTAQTKEHEKNVAQRLTAVNALPRFPDRYSTEAETSAYNALAFPTRNRIELDHRRTVNKNCRAVDNLEKHGLKKKTVRKGYYGSSTTFTPLGVNAIEHRLELLPMELVTDASGTRACWLTLNGTFVGSKTHRPPVSEPKLRSLYVFDAASVDRRFLFDGCGLLDEGDLERLLSPRELSARDEYAARLYLCMRWLGFSMPDGRTVKAAIQRLVAKVKGGAS